MELFDFQKEVLKKTADKNKVAFYLDMGLGKTFVGSEKAMQFSEKTILVVCQKSKIDDWIKHFKENYQCTVFDLTKKDVFEDFVFGLFETVPAVAIINYELVFRRDELLRLNNFTLVLDESSLIQNDQAKRTKFITRLNYKNLVLLSGTPTGGKYENLFSQLKMLGLSMSKTEYWNEFIRYYNADFGTGFPVKIVTGYKNVDWLKSIMDKLGCIFMKTDEVFELPKQNFIDVSVPTSSEYKKFIKTSMCRIDGEELVGDSTLTQLLYERQLCGSYNKNKISQLRDLLSSSDDRFIIFYNYNKELKVIEDICISLNKPTSIVNGEIKDLCCYETENNSVTLIQYQAGAMGLNLQKANRIIYFTPCLSSELFEQSKKRTHRIGQEKTCFYYQLICKDSVEEKIYATLKKRQDYNERLFVQM